MTESLFHRIKYELENTEGLTEEGAAYLIWMQVDNSDTPLAMEFRHEHDTLPEALLCLAGEAHFTAPPRMQSLLDQMHKSLQGYVPLEELLATMSPEARANMINLKE